MQPATTSKTSTDDSFSPPKKKSNKQTTKRTTISETESDITPNDTSFDSNDDPLSQADNLKASSPHSEKISKKVFLVETKDLIEEPIENVIHTFDFSVKINQGLMFIDPK